MRVDFYQLGPGTAIDGVIASLAGRLVGDGQRLLIVSNDEAQIARLDRQLWDQGEASFLPHAAAGGPDDARQPILLAGSPDAPNGARNLLIADGEWREAALNFDRAFFLFSTEQVEPARLAWKLLSGREGVERNFWAFDEGRWVRKA